MPRRLITLPVSPLGHGGYNIAVADDLSRLGGRGPHDHIVIYPHPGQPLPEDIATITRPGKTSPRRYVNLLLGRTSTETSAAQMRAAIGDREFDEIFCGEVTFYRCLRAIFPDRPMRVRFHNLFSLPDTRQRFRRYRLDPVFRMTLATFSRLEREILADPLVDPILIAEAERRYVELVYPGRPIEVWNPPIEVASVRPRPTVPRLAYMGSLAAHQRVGMRYFVDRILPEIREAVPELEFHMFGNGSTAWDQPDRGVHGHGFHDGDGLPLDGDALFVCPDLLGGGIKIKVGEWLQWGLPFIATPYAMDGYDLPTMDNVIVADIDDWRNSIIAYFSTTTEP